jgi:hypothetical protein
VRYLFLLKSDGSTTRNKTALQPYQVTWELMK